MGNMPQRHGGSGTIGINGISTLSNQTSRNNLPTRGASISASHAHIAASKSVGNVFAGVNNMSNMNTSGSGGTMNEINGTNATLGMSSHSLPHNRNNIGQMKDNFIQMIVIEEIVSSIGDYRSPVSVISNKGIEKLGSLRDFRQQRMTQTLMGIIIMIRMIYANRHNKTTCWKNYH